MSRKLAAIYSSKKGRTELNVKPGSGFNAIQKFMLFILFEPLYYYEI